MKPGAMETVMTWFVLRNMMVEPKEARVLMHQVFPIRFLMRPREAAAGGGSRTALNAAMMLLQQQRHDYYCCRKVVKKKLRGFEEPGCRQEKVFARLAP